MARVVVGGVVAGAALLGSLLSATSAEANTWLIPCGDIAQLRSAIESTNLQVGGTVDVVLTSGCTYLLTDAAPGEWANGLPTIHGSSGVDSYGATLFLHGNGATITRDPAAPPFRFLAIDVGGKAIVEDVTFSRGLSPHGGDEEAGSPGGAILNQGTATLTDVVLTLNRTGDGGDGDYGSSNGDSGASSGKGGAIANSGVLTVIGSTLSYNGTGQGGDGGDSIFNGGAGGSSGDGGGISSSGTLTVRDSTIAFNNTGPGGSPGGGTFGGPPAGIGRGGGIASEGDTEVRNSLIRGNTTYGTSGWGGGVYATRSFAAKTVTLANSTIVDNGGSRGGAVFAASGNNFAGSSRVTVNFSHATVAGNYASSGDAVSMEEAIVTFNNTIVSGNGAAGGDCAPSELMSGGQADQGSYAAYGGFLVDSASSGCPATVVADPLLGALGSNGGATLTMALSSGSPAIDTGFTVRCSAEDQRHLARPQGANCDLGAYERPAIPTVGAVSGLAPTLAGTPRPYTVTATHPQGQPLAYNWSVTGVGATITGGTTATPQIEFAGEGVATVHVDVRSANASASETIERTLVVDVGPEDDQPPVVTIPAGATTFPEGSNVTTSFTVYDPEGHSVDWVPGYPQCGSGGTLVSSVLTSTAGEAVCHYPEGDAFPLVKINVRDRYDVADEWVGRAFSVLDVLPTITITGDTTPDEGDTPLYSYTITDPGDDSYSQPTTACTSISDGEIAKIAGSDQFSVAPHTFTGSFRCDTPHGPAGGDAVVTLGLQTKKLPFAVQNVAPTIVVTGPTSVAENWFGFDEGYTYHYTITDPGDTVFPDWGTMSCGGSAGQVMSFTNDEIVCRFRNGPANVAVGLSAYDGAATSSGSMAVAVTNVAPTLTFTAPPGLSVPEGGTSPALGFFASDPGQDTIAVTLPTGCARDVPDSANPGMVSGAFRCTVGDGPAVRTTTMSVFDGVATVPGSIGVPVADVAPSIAATMSPTALWVGTPTTVTLGAISDPGSDTVVEWRVNWRDGVTDTFLSPPGAVSHTFLTDGMQGATVDLRDEDGWHLDVSPELLATVYPASPVLSIVDQISSAPEGTTTTFHVNIIEAGVNSYEVVDASCASGWPYAEPPSILSNLSIVGSSVQFDCGWQSPFKNTTVFLRLKNQDGEFSNPIMFQVAVTNVAPVVTFLPSNPLTVVESSGTEYLYHFTVTDPSPDHLGLVAYAGNTNCGVNGTYLGAGRVGDDWWLRCRFPDGPAASTITLRVTDSDLIAMTTQTVQIVNAAPSALADDVTGAVEGDEVELPYTTSDPGLDSVALQGTPDCGSGDFIRDGVGYFVCSFPDGPATENVTFQVVDEDGATAGGAFSVGVVNAVPTIAIGGSTAHVPGVPHAIQLGTISDPGDDHVNQWIVNWGDGSPVSSYLSATTNPTHVYSGIGPYAIVVDLVDEDGTHPAAGSTSSYFADTVPPVFTEVPGDIVAEAQGPDGAPVNYTIAASDDRSPTSIFCYTGVGEWRPSGFTFPLGTTGVLCHAYDETGNQSTTVQFDVTIVDTTPPSLPVTDPTFAEATGPDGAVVAYSVTATDLVDGERIADCAPAPSTLFPLGPTPVSCSVTDSRNNAATFGFNVVVRDTVGPVVTVSTPAPTEATGASGASVAFLDPTALDAVDGARPAICDRASGAVFPLGSTTVHCTSSDTSGNVGAADFVVLVRDTTDPVVTVPANIPAVEPTGADGAVVTFDPATAVDLVDGAVAAGCDPLSGATFPLGVTTVECTATDAHGNQGVATFTVTVQDSIAPVVTPPADVSAEASSATGALVVYTGGSALDIVGGTLPLACLPASGSLFAIGDTTVSCTATDSAGNSGSGVFHVRVVDTTAPTVGAGADQTIEATSGAGAPATFPLPAATDTVDVVVVVACSPASGTVFPLGNTTVTCTATDDAGKHVDSAFTITVRDTTAPQLTVPSDLLRGGTSAAGANVTFPVSAVDLVDGTVAVDCSPASGSSFGRMTTTVSCAARDAAGNLATASFTVTVRGMALVADAFPGDTELFVASNDGFAPGDYVAIGVEGADPEIRKIDALGSIIVSAPISVGYPAGSIVELIPVADTAAPQITIATPIAGGLFTRGSAPRADFACVDPTGGVGVAACQGSVADGAMLDTSAVGTHSFTVRAWDANGNLSTLSVSYTVTQAGAGGGWLSTTGNEVWIVVLIAAVMLATGLALVLLRRLRRPVVPRSVRRSRD